MGEVGGVSVFFANVIMLPDVARVLACLQEKKIAYKPRDMSKEGGYPVPLDFLKHQAMDRISGPVYIDGEKTVVESRAICRSVCERYADRGNQLLLGKNPLERASVEQWLKFEQQDFDPPSWTLVFHLAYAQPKPDLVLLDQSERKLAAILDVYDDSLMGRSYLAGDEFSLADLCHLPNMHYLANSREWSYLLSSRKHVWKWFRRISERRSWKETRNALNQVHAAAAQSQRVIGAPSTRRQPESQDSSQKPKRHVTRQRQKLYKPPSSQPQMQSEPSTPPPAQIAHSAKATSPFPTLQPQQPNALVTPLTNDPFLPPQKVEDTHATPNTKQQGPPLKSRATPPSAQTKGFTSNKTSMRPPLIDKASPSTSPPSKPQVALVTSPSATNSLTPPVKAQDVPAKHTLEKQFQYSTSPNKHPSTRSKDSTPSKKLDRPPSNDMEPLPNLAQIQPYEEPRTLPTPSRALSSPRKTQHAPATHTYESRIQTVRSPTTTTSSKMEESTLGQAPNNLSLDENETPRNLNLQPPLPSIQTPSCNHKNIPSLKQEAQDAMEPINGLQAQLRTSLTIPYSVHIEDSTLDKTLDASPLNTKTISETSIVEPQSPRKLATSPSLVKDPTFSTKTLNAHIEQSLEPQALSLENPISSPSSQTKDANHTIIIDKPLLNEKTTICPQQSNGSKTQPSLASDNPIIGTTEPQTHTLKGPITSSSSQTKDATPSTIIEEPSSNEKLDILSQLPTGTKTHPSLDSGHLFLGLIKNAPTPHVTKSQTHVLSGSKMTMTSHIKKSIVERTLDNSL